jgi:tetratricopeptide (TPR) repeat protein
VGRYDEALRAAEQAIAMKHHPTLRAWVAQAVALEGLGRAEEARSAAERGLEAVERFMAEEPAYFEAWEAAAALLRLLGQDSEAEAAATHARELVS